MAAVFAALAAMVTVCRRSEKATGIELEYDPETTPTMFTADARSVISDSGYVRYNIIAPEWYVFDAAQRPNWKFNRGLTIEQYDDSMTVDGRFVCDSAIYLTNDRLWEFIGHVRLNYNNGDRFVTQHLYWDEAQGSLRSDSFIHIEKAGKVIEGYGFNSDTRIENYTVNRPTMIIPVSDFRREHTSDSLPTVSEPQPQAAPAPQRVAGGRVHAVNAGLERPSKHTR